MTKKPHLGPMIAKPNPFSRKPPRRLMIPAASPVTITRADGSEETVDSYTATEAAEVIRGGQHRKNHRAQTT